MDEYLKGIIDREPIVEQALKDECLASYNGFVIVESPRLANGWIELRNDKGEVIAHIDNVRAIYIAKRRRP